MPNPQMPKSNPQATAAKSAAAAKALKPLTQQEKHKQDAYKILDDEISSATMAKTFAYVLAQMSMREIKNPEEAKETASMFKSKYFIRHIKKLIDSVGIEGTLKLMSELDPNDMAASYEFMTGFEYNENEDEE